MKHALLYIFYGCDRTCAARLRVYRELNPQLQIFGVCTAGKARRREFRRTESELDDLYFLPDYPAKWCWNNLDKVACLWYRDRGLHLPFERIFVVDWDLLALSPVETFTGQINEEDQISFVFTQQIADARVDHWTSEPAYEHFLKYLQNSGLKHDITTKAWLYAYATSKSVFDSIHGHVIEADGYCEYRLPTIAQCMGVNIRLLRRPQNWHDLTNVNGLSIARSIILDDAQKTNAFGLYHPVYEPYVTKSLEMSWVAFVIEGCMYRNLRRKIARIVRTI